MAVQRSPDIFRQIRQPEESVRLAAVQAKGENIRYVSAPSEAVQLAAVRNDPMNIRYIETLRKGAVCRSERRPGCGTVYQFAYRRDQKIGDGNVRPQTGKCRRQGGGSGPDIRNLRKLRKESGGGRGKETFGKAGQRGGGETG